MFLEKYAKLKSYIEDDGKHIHVEVVDDELKGSNEVMYLNAEIDDFAYDQKVIFVNEIDFFDENFFKMPENRQQSCANALFKRFLKHYNENYGRNSDVWVPVVANFANYDLQEKFKTAVDKGIFPPQSLELSDFTSESTYNEDDHYNMKNRKDSYQQEKRMKQLLFDNISNNYIDESGALINLPISELINAKQKLGEDAKESTTFKIDQDGSIYFNAPLYDIDPLFNGETGNVTLTGDNDTIVFNNFEEVKDLIVQNEDNFRRVFDTVKTYNDSNLNEVKTIDSIFDNQTIVSSRLRKNR